jgi:hypothetical protein
MPDGPRHWRRRNGINTLRDIFGARVSSRARHRAARRGYARSGLAKPIWGQKKLAFPIRSACHRNLLRVHSSERALGRSDKYIRVKNK